VVGEYFGRAAASAGDVDGDGYADVAVTAPAANQVFIYHGGSAGIGLDPQVLQGPASSGYGTVTESAGDVDADGFSEVVVSAYNFGQAFLYMGSSGGLSQSPLTLSMAVNKDFGVASGVGDVDGDGFGDLTVSTASESAIYLYLGGAQGIGPSTSPKPIFGGPQTGAFGNSVADPVISTTPPSFP
jgi:hypothetical protein